MYISFILKIDLDFIKIDQELIERLQEDLVGYKFRKFRNFGIHQ